jgi:hypothetical protein
VVAGELDGLPGEDLTLRVADELWRHASDGASGFASATPVATSLDSLRGVLAGDFDADHPGDELLVWGEGGAALERPDGSSLSFSTDAVGAVTVFDLGSPIPSVMLHVDGEPDYRLYDLDGQSTAVASISLAEPNDALASILGASAGFHVATSGDAVGWRSLLLLEPGTGAELGRWAIPMRSETILVGDLNADLGNDLVRRRRHRRARRQRSRVAQSLTSGPAGRMLGCWLESCSVLAHARSEKRRAEAQKAGEVAETRRRCA